MKAKENTNGSGTLAQGSNGHDLSPMPEGFGALYQAAYESGYAKGREAGHRQGFTESYAAAHQDVQQSAAVASAFEGKTAQKREPRRVLLGMPCEKCGVYLHSDEAYCPSCGLPRKAAEPRKAKAPQG
jgi:rubrerythrin